jgi:hypothetical protein
MILLLFWSRPRLPTLPSFLSFPAAPRWVTHSQHWMHTHPVTLDQSFPHKRHQQPQKHRPGSPCFTAAYQKPWTERLQVLSRTHDDHVLLRRSMVRYLYIFHMLPFLFIDKPLHVTSVFPSTRLTFVSTHASLWAAETTFVGMTREVGETKMRRTEYRHSSVTKEYFVRSSSLLAA